MATILANADKIVALMARTSSPVLVISLRALHADKPGPERNLVMHWTETELLARYPQAQAAVNAAYDRFDAAVQADEDIDAADFDAVDVLIAALPEDVR